MADYPNFVGPSYTSSSPNADAEQTMNLYPEVMESAGAKVPTTLYPCPGFQIAATVAQSPGRGLFATGGTPNRLFGVVGFKLYEYVYHSVTGVMTPMDRGDVAADTNPATFTTNGVGGNQLGFTSGGIFYVLDLGTNTLTPVMNLPPVTMCDFISDRFIALAPDTSELYMSNQEDGLTWDLSNVILRSTAPDPWVSMKVILHYIWLMGTLTSDVYYDDGGSPIPFSPFPGGSLEQGIAAPFSLQDVDGTAAWIGNNVNGRGVIWRAQGFIPQRISTHAVEFALQQYPTIDDAVSFAYQQEGHSFYVTNFPSGAATWVYDAATQPAQWHERGYWNTTAAEFEAYRVQYHANAFQQQWALDRATGTLYQMRTDLLTDVDGAMIRRVRRAPHLSTDQRMTFYHRVQVDLQAGVGTASVTSPTVMLRYSDDGAHTWSNEIEMSAGPQGAYAHRVFCGPLGSSRDRVFEVAMSDAVNWRVLQAFLDTSPGTY